MQSSHNGFTTGQGRKIDHFSPGSFGALLLLFIALVIVLSVIVRAENHFCSETLLTLSLAFPAQGIVLDTVVFVQE